MNIYLPDALRDKARRVLPPERSISKIAQEALEREIAAQEAAGELAEGVVV